MRSLFAPEGELAEYANASEKHLKRIPNLSSLPTEVIVDQHLHFKGLISSGIKYAAAWVDFIDNKTPQKKQASGGGAYEKIRPAVDTVAIAMKLSFQRLGSVYL